MIARKPGLESGTLFARAWTTAEGLGPTFNARSCAACHHVGGEATFVHVLPAPSGAMLAARDRRGGTIFAKIGCAKCHRPAFVVRDGRGHLPVNAYTDLLLHDMGPALADGIVEGNASGQEFRTPPLWGLSRYRGPYLHDGRAKTLDDAIRMHGGEADNAAAAYVSLPSDDARALQRFLRAR